MDPLLVSTFSALFTGLKVHGSQFGTIIGVRVHVNVSKSNQTFMEFHGPQRMFQKPKISWKQRVSTLHKYLWRLT